MNKEEIELARQEKSLADRRRYLEVRKAVTRMRCPVCGAYLKGNIYGPVHDTADCHPVIFCDKVRGCGYFLAEGPWFSMYDRDADIPLALQRHMESVKRYIKEWGPPAEEDY